jgi:hypothetical protein
MDDTLAIVMRRSGVRFPEAALGRYPLSLITFRQGATFIVRPCPVVPPSRWAASHKLRSIMCPYRSIVMAAVACPSTR